MIECVAVTFWYKPKLSPWSHNLYKLEETGNWRNRLSSSHITAQKTGFLKVCCSDISILRFSLLTETCSKQQKWVRMGWNISDALRGGKLLYSVTILKSPRRVLKPWSLKMNNIILLCFSHTCKTFTSLWLVMMERNLKRSEKRGMIPNV